MSLVLSESLIDLNFMKLAVLITHPIQYFAPVFRKLAVTPGIDLHIFFGCDHGSRVAHDPSFKTAFSWDSSPAEGFPRTFLSSGNIRGLSGFLSVSLGLKAVRDINAFHPDAVLIFSYSPVFIIFATVLLKVTGNTLLLRAETTDKALERSWLKDFIRSLFLKLYYKQFSFVFPIGTNSVEHYKRMDVALERQLTAMYSVDVDYFERQVKQWMPKRLKLRELAGIPVSDHVFMYCGKMFPPKDPLIIPAALALLPAEKLGRLWLIAVGEGELRPEFERCVSTQLKKRALFVGFRNQSELGKYYAISNTLILPSKSGETWGLVVNEALQFGMGFIVSDIVGCGNDLISRGAYGQIFKSKDPAALSSAIEMAMEREGRVGMGTVRIPHPSLFVKAILSAMQMIKEGSRGK